MEWFYEIVGDIMDFNTVPAKQLGDYIGQYNTIIIDLRDKDEYEAGHVPTAVNIPYESLDKYKYKLSDFNEIILYCDRGSSSLLASRALSKLGYKVVNIYGGFHAYRGDISKEKNSPINLDWRMLKSVLIL